MFSDLHADVARHRPIMIAPDIDVVVVAGDTCEGAKNSFSCLRQFVPMQIPIVAVLGNHEFYRRCWSEELALARGTAPLYGIHLLENDAIKIGDVRFVGCTLWTDYGLCGDVTLAMLVAARGLNDHKRIAWSKRPWARFRPQEASRLHQRSRAFIEATLAVPSEGATVVVTHHAPHPASGHPHHGHDLLSAAYVSDLSRVIETGQPDLWIHGHVHSSFDYRVGQTRVICNAHGYHENPGFDPSFIVEVGK